MSTFGWGMIAVSFLLLVALINNSWQPFVDRIRALQPSPSGADPLAPNDPIRDILPHTDIPYPPANPSDPEYVPGAGPPLAMAPWNPGV